MASTNGKVVESAPAPPNPGPKPPVPLTPAPPANPLQEYLAGGPLGRGYINTVYTLSLAFDDATLDFGAELYEVMLNDPTVNSAINTLKQGILDKDPELMPALQRLPEGQTAGPEDPSKADLDLAEEIHAFCTRMLGSMKRPLFDVLFELLDAMALGCKLGEKIYRICESGPDKGRMYLDRVKVKPRHVWQFVVDPRTNVLGILGLVPGAVNPPPRAIAYTGATLGAAAFLPREKFALLSWLPRNEDPRGTSVLRPAYTAWRYKLRTIPAYSDFLDRMAAGFLWGTYAPEAPYQDATDAAGHVIPGAQLPPDQAMLNTLVQARNNTAIVTPPGSSLQVIHPPRGGEVFTQALDFLIREIVFAILQTTRANLESQYGSRADSETAQDEKGLATRIGKRFLCGLIRNDFLKDAVRFNFGNDAAERLTPLVTIGEVEHHAFAVEATAIAALTTAGYLDQSQLPGIDQRLGLPKRQEIPGPGPAGVGGATPSTPSQPQPSPRPAKPTPKPAAA